MNYANIHAITIPEGVVKQLTINGSVVWQASPDIPTADNLTGVWVFNDTFSISMLTASKYTVTVTIGRYYYTHTSIGVSNGELYGAGSKNGTTWLTSNGKKWRDPADATWDFGTIGQAVPADFYAWLTANSTYQG